MLEQIIRIASDEGDLVLDPFCEGRNDCSSG
ncbi:hypothetical protein [Lentibacillus sp. CBA3610]